MWDCCEKFKLRAIPSHIPFNEKKSKFQASPQWSAMVERISIFFLRLHENTGVP
jgi:hypothetical protein